MSEIEFVQRIKSDHSSCSSLAWIDGIDRRPGYQTTRSTTSGSCRSQVEFYFGPYHGPCNSWSRNLPKSLLKFWSQEVGSPCWLTSIGCWIDTNFSNPLNWFLSPPDWSAWRIASSNGVVWTDATYNSLKRAPNAMSFLPNDRPFSASSSCCGPGFSFCPNQNFS